MWKKKKKKDEQLGKNLEIRSENIFYIAGGCLTVSSVTK